MTVDGSEFSVIDDLGATISVCKTEREAWWKKLSTAHMRMHDLDRQAAFDWAREAAD